MKILYDHQIFSTQKYGGISRYFYEIMKDKDYILPLILNKNKYLQKGIDLFDDFRGKTRLYKFINNIYTTYKLKNEKYDIFHPTYYDTYFLKNLKSPFVLTIHDMIHEKFQEIMNPNDNTAYEKKLLASKAKRIIAVSEQTKKDIVEILNIDKDKIEVIYHGSDFDKIKEDKNFSNKLPKKYILFTGNRGGYKNFQNFTEALKDFLLKDDDLYLVCAGGGNFTSTELEIFDKMKINSKLLHFSCNDNQLKSLYKNAMFFIFPSLYEGFGIPLLEAMGSDTPILCSDTSCFPEIAQDSAIYFDPNDITDMKEKIKFALSSGLDFYIEKGRERFKYFSWDKARKETMEVYRGCVR